MGIFRRLAGFLGFSKDEARDVQDEHTTPQNNNNNNVPHKGFSVPVSRDLPGPIIIPCNTSTGGVQGLKWYAKRLRIDEDGDVADEFLNEIPSDTPSSTEENHKKFPRFELKYTTKLAKGGIDWGFSFLLALICEKLVPGSDET